MINLADAKISYEGQTLPAMNLISRLQAQLRESACRIATIAETLGDLQTALLSFQTVAVKLTLSQEEYDRFKFIEGADDQERIYKAVMTAIDPEQAGMSREGGAPLPSAPVAERSPAPLSTATTSPETAAGTSIEPAYVKTLEPSAADSPPPGKTITPGSAPAKRPSTRCPTCEFIIDLPGTSFHDWPVQLKCRNCGATCIVSSPSMKDRQMK